MSFRFRKKNIIVRRTLAKIVEKIKVTKLTYFIAPLLHSRNSLKQKDFSQKLVFTVAVLLKVSDIDTFLLALFIVSLDLKSKVIKVLFMKQLGINCTCEHIGLFLISTRGCGSHSWKLPKSPICSRVQLIPNCFSNRPISYTNRPISDLIFLRRCIKFNPPIRVRLALIGLWATQSNHRLNFNRGLAYLIGVLNNRAQDVIFFRFSLGWK